MPNAAGKVTHKQYRLQRKIASMAIAAGGFGLQELPRAYDYEALFLRINGSVQVSVAGATAVRAEAPCQWVARIEVIADGKNTLYSAPFWFASLGHYTRSLPASGAPDAGLFNNFILESGVDVRLNLAAKNLRAKNNADYGQLTAGYYVGDVTSTAEGRIKLADLWDVTGQAQPDTTMDVTGGANVNVQVVVTEYILARAA